MLKFWLRFYSLVQLSNSYASVKTQFKYAQLTKLLPTGAQRLDISPVLLQHVAVFCGSISALVIAVSICLLLYPVRVS